MLILQQLSYEHSDKTHLFEGLQLTVNKYDKIALIGNNGSGKSTLLKIIAGQLLQSSGEIHAAATPYYIPQQYGQFNELTIAEALNIDRKLYALQQILAGTVTDELYNQLEDDWTIEERSKAALQHWQLEGLDLNQQMASLSGGEKTKVFLAGIYIHQPEFILLDEPSNHLDATGRALLYQLIESTRSTLIVVSHDRTLLNLIDQVAELNHQGISNYAGNYDFYIGQKRLENEALMQDLQHTEKALRKARDKQRETIERQQKLDSRGKRKQENAGVARIMMNTLRNKAENSTSKLKGVHAEKIDSIQQDLQELRSVMPEADKIKFGFENTILHKGKILCKATAINYQYTDKVLWKEDLSFQLNSGDKVHIKGLNGSGKTTLIKLMLGQIEPISGTIYRAINKSIYIDQEYSLLSDELNLYQQAQVFNSLNLEEHELKIRLHRFLFKKEDWNKSCSALSGGGKIAPDTMLPYH